MNIYGNVCSVWIDNNAMPYHGGLLSCGFDQRNAAVSVFILQCVAYM